MSEADRKRFERWLLEKEARLSRSEGERIWDEVLSEYGVGLLKMEVSSAIFGMRELVVAKIDEALEDRCRIERESEGG